MDSSTTQKQIIDRAFLAELQGMRMLSRKIFRGQMRGERRSRNKGQSVEFVDYRPYMSGDDIRRIDWNLYGRLERFHIKLFEEEEDLRLYLIIDCSASMDYGNPSKFEQAVRLAAALSYIVLANLETVSVSIFAQGYQVITSPTRGKAKIHSMIHKLNQLKPAGSSDLGGAAARFRAHATKSGIVCVISDFLTEEGIEVMTPLLGGGHQLELIQVLAPEEINPQLTGDLELVDRESGQGVEVSMGQQVMRRYHQRLDALKAELKSFALRGSGDYFLLSSSQPLRDFVFGTLRSGRLIR